MANAITVYSKPSCVQCTATYRRLDDLGVRYEIADALDAEGQQVAGIAELGHLSAPVVVVRDDAGEILAHWSGFRRDLITEHASAA